MTRNDADARPELQALQRLQVQFDDEHGFDFAQQGASAIQHILFASLALSGEVGELANAVKKAQRAAWLGQASQEHLQAASGELADAFAYLLKLSSLLEVDLDEAYLTTLSDNYLRFPARKAAAKGRVLSLAGPPGAGKTAVATALSAFFPTLLNSVAADAHLGEFSDALERQHELLGQIRRILHRASPDDDVLLDEEPTAVVRVYTRALRDHSGLSAANYIQLLRELIDVESVLGRWRGTRQIVFLDAPVATLHARLLQRGDPYVAPPEWLSNVREYFAELHRKVPSSVIVSTEGRSIDAIVAQVKAEFGLI